nr:TetR/AcrR family transcriptional regulator [uncultured Carboxylicivirga sp.]
MRNQSPTYQKWLEAAYCEFACFGPEFSLKGLANKVKMPRATLYYHFDNKDHLTQELLQYHYKMAEQFLNDIRSDVFELIPDLYRVMVRYPESVRFHQQLLRNNHLQAFNDVYKSINIRSIEILIPVIRKYFASDRMDKEIFEFYNTLTDAWYARLNCKNISVDHMCNLAIEIMEHTLGLYNHPKVKSL